MASPTIPQRRSASAAQQRFGAGAETPSHRQEELVGSEDGAEANVTFVSLIASCQMHGIEPWAYLRDLLCLLPDWPVKRVLELAPLNWQQTFEQQHTQELLAANIYRAATL